MRLKSTLFAGVLAASMVAPVYANNEPAAPRLLPQFTVQDTQALFEQDYKPMQLAALSSQEMKETEGAWLFLIPIGIGSGLVGWAGAFFWSSMAFGAGAGGTYMIRYALR